jgi:DNA-binding NarL/FixJ family response regulator
MLDLLLVEDNARLRPALRTGLEATGAVRVVYDCASGEEALEYCLAQPPQAILMDVQLAGAMNGIQAAVAIRRELPRLPVVFYSIQDDDAYYRDFRCSGILSHYAYVRKSNYLLPQMIVPLLIDAVAGRSFIDPEIETRVQEVQRKDEQAPLALLEPIEQEVARFLAQGLSNEQSAVAGPGGAVECRAQGLGGVAGGQWPVDGGCVSQHPLCHLCPRLGLCQLGPGPDLVCGVVAGHCPAPHLVRAHPLVRGILGRQDELPVPSATALAGLYGARGRRARRAAHLGQPLPFLLADCRL